MGIEPTFTGASTSRLAVWLQPREVCQKNATSRLVVVSAIGVLRIQCIFRPASRYSQFDVSLAGTNTFRPGIESCPCAHAYLGDDSSVAT